jgi:hypothetical protein
MACSSISCIACTPQFWPSHDAAEQTQALLCDYKASSSG